MPSSRRPAAAATGPRPPGRGPSATSRDGAQSPALRPPGLGLVFLTCRVDTTQSAVTPGSQGHTVCWERLRAADRAARQRCGVPKDTRDAWGRGRRPGHRATSLRARAAQTCCSRLEEPRSRHRRRHGQRRAAAADRQVPGAREQAPIVSPRRPGRESRSDRRRRGGPADSVPRASRMRTTRPRPRPHKGNVSEEGREAAGIRAALVAAGHGQASVDRKGPVLFQVPFRLGARPVPVRAGTGPSPIAY